MAHSPATPIKAGMHAIEPPSQVDLPFTEKLTSTSKVKRASLHEPSPASTYGDTAADSSPPATPQEPSNHGPCTTKLTHQDVAVGLRAMQIHEIDPAIQAHSGSPMMAREAKFYCATTTSASTNSSPHTNRVDEIRQSPNWRSSKDWTFVRLSSGQADDPFVSNGNCSRSPDESHGSFQPREDRVNVPLSSNTAQAVLPPNACVFVANLTQTATDDQLEHAVTVAFAQFGCVYVKIRRDNKGMPFAFCQYESVPDAQRAIALGRNMLINGRPCRTEVAKVNRSLYLSRISGGPITETEARQILTGYGPIEKVWLCSQTDREMFRLPEGIWVMFAYYDDCRDAQVKFRDHPGYRLEQPKMPEDVRGRVPGRAISLPCSPMYVQSPGSMVSPRTGRQMIDSCSIFVGNLSPQVTQEDLYQLFHMYGRIQHIEVVHKPIANGHGINAFAFVEYASHTEANTAVLASPRVHQGGLLRVERKESIDPVARRGNLFTSGGSPRNQCSVDTQDAMAMLFYQRGLAAGMSQATQPQLMPPPVYPAYPYYMPYDLSQYGQYAAPATAPVANEAAAAIQQTAAAIQHTNTAYMHQPMGQFNYSQMPPPYVPPQQQPTQQAVPKPFTPYEWPPRSTRENSNSAGAIAHEAR